MSDTPKSHTIVLIENYWQGFWQSVCWLAVLALTIGYAVWIGSSAMQWIMGLFWFLTLIGWLLRRSDKLRMTIPEARKRLDEIEAGKHD